MSLSYLTAISIATATIIGPVLIYLTHQKLFATPPENKSNARINKFINAAAVALDFSEEALRNEIQTRWRRPLSGLPVHADLPRLARKMTIIVNGETLIGNDLEQSHPLNQQIEDDLANQTVNNDNININEEQQKTEISTVILQVLSILASTLYDEEESTRINRSFRSSRYFASVNAVGDVAKTLSDFLRTELGDDSKVTKILKACNQSIISPAVVRLKYSSSFDSHSNINPNLGSPALSRSRSFSPFSSPISKDRKNARETQSNSNILQSNMDYGSLENFAYKDVRGGWKILIIISSRQDDPHRGITVIHRKREKSFIEGSFEFLWELTMRFDLELNQMLDANLGIVDIHYGAKDDQPRKQKLRQLLDRYWRVAV